MPPIKSKHLFAVREILLFLVAVAAAYVASGYLTPWYANSALSPDVSQTGWPIAYSASALVDYSNNKGAVESSFEFGALVVDLGLFYLIINYLELLVEYVGRRSRRENNPLRLREWILQVAKRMVVMLLLAFLVYGIFNVLFASLFGSIPAQAVTPK